MGTGETVAVKQVKLADLPKSELRVITVRKQQSSSMYRRGLNRFDPAGNRPSQELGRMYLDPYLREGHLQNVSIPILSSIAALSSRRNRSISSWSECHRLRLYCCDLPLTNLYSDIVRMDLSIPSPRTSASSQKISWGSICRKYFMDFSTCMNRVSYIETSKEPTSSPRNRVSSSLRTSELPQEQQPSTSLA